jgi:hypothetical protein
MDKLPIASAIGRPELHNYVTGIYGMSGSGKTAWVEEKLISKKKRLVVIDTNGHDYGNEDFCKATGITYDAILYDRTEMVEYLKRDSFRLIVRDHGHEMDALNVFTSRNNRRDPSLITNVVIAVDEAHRYMDAYSIAPQLEDIVTVGRHSGIDFVGIAQIPKGQTNPLFRSMLSFIVSFRQMEKETLDFFRSFDDHAASELRDMKRGECNLFFGDRQEFLAYMERE